MYTAVSSSEAGTCLSVLPCAAVIFRFDGSQFRLTWANDKYFALFGCTKSDYLDIQPNDFGFRMLDRKYSSYLSDKIATLINNCSEFSLDIEASRADGERITIHAEVSVCSDGGEYVLNCIFHNINDISAAAKASSDLNAMMMSVMSISADNIFEYRVSGDCLKAYKNVGGNFVERLSVNDFEQYFRSGGFVCEDDEDSFEQLCTNIKSGIDKGTFEMRLKGSDDPDYKWYRVSYKTIRDRISNAYIGAVGKTEDISGLKSANQRLIEKAERDPLTKLYNKAATKSLIKNCLRTDSRETYDAFIIVDVDNFKQVNDTLGHLFGDSLLVELAQEMQDLFRSNDIIGRIGGDEFIVFLRGLKQLSHIESKADDLCKIFKLLYSEDDGVKVSGSLGIALYPQDGDTFDELYRKADIALYTSKRSGKSCYHFYKSGEEAVTESKPVPRVERYSGGVDFVKGQSGFESDILGAAFELAESGGDINDAINGLINKIGKHLNVGRITISEADESANVFRDTYCWNSKNTDPPRNDSVRYTVKEMNKLCSCFDKNLIFPFDDTDESGLKDNAFTAHLRSNKARCALVCGYFRGGSLIGTVAFQECSAHYLWSIEQAKALKELTRTVFSYLCRLRDFDKAKEIADYASNYDSLTGLMNFSCFSRQVKECVASALDGDRFIMFFSDFSNFSYINNKFGFEAGNNMLKSFAGALKYFSENIKYVCRIAADKFCAFGEYSDGIISSFEGFLSRFSANEKLAGGSTGFGISSSAFIFDPISGMDFDSAYDNLNLALKYAKQSLVGKCAVYRKEMREELNRSVEISADAAKALLNNEFKVYFQPKVSIDNTEIVGAEALIRWIKPNGTVVSPDSFVPLLEKNGFIVKIDFFVYEQVCRYLRNRIDEGKPVVPISVNVSRIHLLTGNFVEKINEVVRKYSIDPGLIELELTESVFLANEDEAVRTIERLKACGFRMSIDDFGSGYSSLSMLKKMPVDVLKIDKSFLSENPAENKSGILLSSVIDMADKMNISIVCEGVETEEQVDFLRDSKCSTVQGFYFAKPVPAGDFEELMDNGITADKKSTEK